MTPSWAKVRRIVEAVMDCPLHRRERLLDRACRGDVVLRRQVMDLMASEVRDDAWLASPVPGAARRLAEETRWVGHEGFGGRYCICDVIGAGGMGVVLGGLDESVQPPTPVAIKVLSDRSATRRLVRAFRREQRLLEQLDHPNITRLIDSGISDDGRPFIVMEHVSGRPIDAYVRETGKSVDERLALFRAVCLAVHHAHQNLIVHRDLKPANILVRDDDVVKLLDFGIAKVLRERQSSDVTVTETVRDAMTLQYSSPEQIRGEPITTATDVYSLGVILFELLAGRPPYALRGVSRYEAERIICESAPTSARQAFQKETRQVKCPWRVALDRIVAKAMHPEPHRRYASAEQLSEDIRRYLEGATVLAYKAGQWERARSALRRHRLAFGATAAAFFIVSGLAITSSVLAHRAAEARDREARARVVSERINGFLNELLAMSGSAHPQTADGAIRVLEEASVIAGRELGDQPEIAAGIYHQIASTYTSLRHSNEARRNYESALACYRRSARPDAERMAACLIALGANLSFHDDERGLAMQREALALRRQLYGTEDLRVAESLHALGFALTRCARPPRYAEAEEHYRQALALRRRLGAGESAAVAENLHAVAALLRHEGKLEASANQYEEALAMSRRVLDPLDRQLIDCMEDEAVCLRDLGRYEQAEKLLQEAVSLTERAFGESAAAFGMIRLSELCDARGDRPGAWRCAHDALARACRAVSQDTSGETGERWRRMTDLFVSRPMTAQPAAYEELMALAPLSYSAGKLAPNLYCSALDQMSRLAAGDGRPDLAERLSRACLKAQADYNPEHVLIRARYERTLADALVKLNRAGEAKGFLEEACAVLRVQRGPEHGETKVVEAMIRSLMGA